MRMHFASPCISMAVILKGIISSRLGDLGIDHNRQYKHSSTGWLLQRYKGKKLLLTRIRSEIGPSHHYQWEPGVSSCGLKVSSKPFQIVDEGWIDRLISIRFWLSLIFIPDLINTRWKYCTRSLDLTSLERRCGEFRKLPSSRACARECQKSKYWQMWQDCMKPR